MRSLVLILCCIAALEAAAAQPPETILAIARPKAGKEAELLDAIRDDHAIMTRLGLITGPYTLYRGNDEGGTSVYILTFTWKSGDIPDNAPPEIRNSWKRLGALVEKKGSCPGSEFWAIETIPNSEVLSGETH